MGYSIAKMIEAALTYIMNSELKNPHHELPEGPEVREILINYIQRRLDYFKQHYK
jgi:hypothetical protein